MQKETIYNRIKEFETEANIKVFNSKYGNLWPVFRMHIFNNIYFNKQTELEYKNKLYRKLSNIKQIFLEFRNYKFKKFRKPKINTFYTEMWFSDYKNRNKKKFGFNKYLDPFFLKLSGKSTAIFEKTFRKPHEYSFKHFNGKIKIQNTIPFMLYYKCISLLRNIFSYKSCDYNRFICEFKMKKLIKFFPEYKAYAFFVEYLNFIETYKFYLWFFNKHTNLNYIYIVAYYFTENMALIAAANNINLETIEIQHGMQSEAHYGYGSWNYIPDNGYKLLPNTFFVFSEKEKLLILNSFKNKHKVNVVGDLNFQLWSKGKKSVKKHIILISLQNRVISEGHFLYKGLETFYAQNNTFKIVFRLHPSYSYIKEEMCLILENFTFIYSWDINSEIFDTLSETKIHITQYSSVVEDALQLNVPSIIIDKIGTEFYKDRVKDIEIVQSALNTKEFLKVIRNYI